jgi:hypothetical protein
VQGRSGSDLLEGEGAFGGGDDIVDDLSVDGVNLSELLGVEGTDRAEESRLGVLGGGVIETEDELEEGRGSGGERGKGTKGGVRDWIG